jgi:hypothetical protein
MNDPKVLELMARSASPFAQFAPNPSLTLDTQNSWGRTSVDLEGAQHEQLVGVQLPIMAYLVVVGRAVQFDNGDNPTQLYPFARIRYGHGNVLQEIIVNLTGGWSEPLVGSTVYMEVYLADEDGDAPEAGSGASAQIQGWACVGTLPFPQRNTQMVTSTETGPTSLIASACEDGPIQGRLARLFGFVDFTGSPPGYLLVFDSNIAPGAAGFGTPKIIDVFPLSAAGIVQFDRYYDNTVPFINGISYGVSTSPTSYVAGSSSDLRITAEQLLDS